MNNGLNLVSLRRCLAGCLSALMMSASLGQTPAQVAPPPTAFTRSDTGRVISSVGEEGFGPYIVAAQASGDPFRARLALEILAECDHHGRWLSLSLLRSDWFVDPSLYLAPDQLARARELEAMLTRHCRSIHERHQALRGPLAWLATSGGYPGTAVLAAASSDWASLGPDVQARLRSMIRRDLRLGNPGTPLRVVRCGFEWGLSDEDWLLAVMQMDTGNERMLDFLNFLRTYHKLPLPDRASLAWQRAEARARAIQQAEPVFTMMDLAWAFPTQPIGGVFLNWFSSQKTIAAPDCRPYDGP